MSRIRRLGTEEEDFVAKHLLNLGYTIVTRRYKAPHGEVDIIALDGETLVFVEVRSRSNGLISPEESVTAKKADHFRQAVEHYFHQTGQPNVPARYDLVAIDQNGLRHHKNAL
ncbi:YraN family protein [Kamptonema cortianum]|nr:YraN family protein [Geitlerinema splendidum]MDK3155213.1 YraN family protein [Kamptonema cortianum]